MVEDAGVPGDAREPCEGISGVENGGREIHWGRRVWDAGEMAESAESRGRARRGWRKEHMPQWYRTIVTGAKMGGGARAQISGPLSVGFLKGHPGVVLWLRRALKVVHR